MQFSTIAFGLVIGLLYFILLLKCSKSNRSFFKILIVSAILIFLTNFAADYYVIKKMIIGESTWFTTGILAAFHSIEIFVFQTHFFDNGYQEFLFGKNVSELAHPGLAYLMAITFILAIITSISLIIKLLGRKRAGRSWLAANKNKASKAHVFFSGGDMSLALAKDIRDKHPDDCLIFIGYPDPEESLLDMSLMEKINLLLSIRKDDQLGPFNAIVYSHIPLSETNGNGICKQMNLKDLDAYLRNASCKVYLLSDNEEENLHCTELLYNDGCTAEIFCRACREGTNQMYEKAMTATPSMNVHLVDSSHLTVRNLKNYPKLLPVEFVDKGTDENNLREGWVSSDFNSMILGFGETGREMLGFLYEFGAFVNKDFKKSPFSCVVMDRKMNDLEYSYRKSFPGLNETSGISFKQCDVDSNDFWEYVSKHIMSLNYIVVCLGNDRVNLKMAVDLVKYAYSQGKDLSKNFVILIAQESPSHLDEITLKHYNSIQQYGNCIRTFGNKSEVWTYDNITNESLTARAKRYFGGYMKAQGDDRDAEAIWAKREEEITSTSDFALHSKRVRQRSQDYANCFHIHTKFALIGPEIYEHRHEIAQCIPPSYTKGQKHYTGNDAHVEKVLQYLAVHEHIRWEASHVALGYAPGQRTDEINKTHECIKDYDDLTPDKQHYDYLVIKTTFDA